MMPDAETVRQLALSLPDAVERTSYGTPAFFVKKKLFARLLEDADTVVIKIDFAQRQILMQAKPQTYFITDHYLNYPMMIVRLSKVTRTALRDLLKGCIVSRELRTGSGRSRRGRGREAAGTDGSRFGKRHR